MAESFGHILRSHRLSMDGRIGGNRFGPARKGASQTQIAALAGISVSYVKRLEDGERSPSRSVVTALAGALGLRARETNRLLTAAGYTGVGRRGA